jgi:drug/metabolite transporter (DMT)-like permease
MAATAAAKHPPSDLRRGAAYMIASAFFFTLMGVGVKLAAQALPNAVIVFLRNALGLVFLLPWLLRPGLSGLATRRLGEHAVRGLAGLAAMSCFFFAIAHLRLADALLLNYSLPIFVPFVERGWLGEPLPPRVWRGILLGFAGLIVVLRPGLGVLQPAALVGLLSALFAATAQVGVRKLTLSEPTVRIVFYFSVIATLGSLPFAALSWRDPEPAEWAPLLGLGLAATLGQLCLTRAYAQAPAAQVGPFIYSSVLFGGLFDWWLWRRLPDAAFAAGGLLVCAAGVVLLRDAARPQPPLLESA